MDSLQVAHPRSAPAAESPSRKQAASRTVKSRGNVLPHDQSWAYHVRLLTSFLEKHGRTPRTQASDLAEYELGQWLAAVISRDNRGLISAERRQQLLGVHPLVAKRILRPALKDTWQANLQDLTAFIVAHHRMPHASRSASNEAFLGRWLQRQSRVMRLGEMPEQKTLALKHAHPLLEQWCLSDSPGDQWSDSFELVCAYVNEHHRLPGKDEPRLQMWVGSNAGRAKRGELSAARLESLAQAPDLLKQRFGLVEELQEDSLAA